MLTAFAENSAEYNGKHNHIKQRLKKTPKNSKPGVSVFQPDIFKCKFIKQISVFFKHCHIVVNFNPCIVANKKHLLSFTYD